MSTMPTNTDPDRFDLLEMDDHRSTRTEDALPDEAAERFGLLEIDAPVPPQEIQAEPSQTQDDVVPEFGAPSESILDVEAGDALSNIAAESSANANTRRVYGNLQVQQGDANAAHDTSGIVHQPAGPSIFERPVAERRFIVGQSANEAEVLRPGQLKAGEVVAGAVAEGHGVLVGWRGDRQITRAVLLEALRGIGREEWAPKPKDARAQAGRAMSVAGSSYHVKADRKGAVTSNEGTNVSGRHTWRIGEINSMGRPGDNYGRTVAVMTLSPEGELGGNGDTALISRIVADYTSRCAQELYTSADLTAWLDTVLATHCGAISYGRSDLYIPARYRDDAIALCNAVSATGWGSDWLGSKERPALPIATCDELRDGIARGLKDEVAQVLGKLHAEREAAAEAKAVRMTEAIVHHNLNNSDTSKIRAAEALAGDIGPTRAGTFLKELRAIATRVAAYSEILGDERCSSAKRAVHEAVRELEGLVDEANSGIVQRFALIFDELQDDMRRSGGVL